MGYTPPYLEVRKIAGGYEVYPPSLTTTDDLTIYPNGTDTRPYIKLNGAGALTLATPNAAYINVIELNTEVFRIGPETTPDFILESIVNNNNIFLKTAGTGVLKFGTYTAGAATDSTGYITILDAAGNTRKLMVQA